MMAEISVVVPLTIYASVTSLAIVLLVGLVQGLARRVRAIEKKLWLSDDR